MTEKKEKKHGSRKKKMKEDWPLPHCTTAPASEHFRAADEDEPCDDARGTVIEEENE